MKRLLVSLVSVVLLVTLLVVGLTSPAPAQSGQSPGINFQYLHHSHTSCHQSAD